MPDKFQAHCQSAGDWSGSVTTDYEEAIRQAADHLRSTANDPKYPGGHLCWINTIYVSDKKSNSEESEPEEQDPTTSSSNEGTSAEE